MLMKTDHHGRVAMSAVGLGRVKTLREERALKDRGDSGTCPARLVGYALIAAISGWMPMMFITRVRL
jgi:hypothetical protein